MCFTHEPTYHLFSRFSMLMPLSKDFQLMPYAPHQSESRGDDLWARVVGSYRPVFTVFHQDGYGQPCGIMAPVLEQANEVFGEAIRIAEFDVVSNRELATSEAVMTIPTTLLINNGKEVSRLEGFPGLEPTLEWMTEQLGALGVTKA